MRSPAHALSSFKVAREGGFLLEIAPATGPKTCTRPVLSTLSRSRSRLLAPSAHAHVPADDWQSKITFFLSVNELGALIHSFGAGGQGALELLHDQNAGTSSAGKDRDAFKKLKAARMPDGATMFSIYEGDKGYNLPVSHSEMVVLLELARFTIPRALGFDKGMEAITQ